LEVGDAFGPMPTHAAGLYGDKDFARMVQSKVYGVHLLVLLGYDVLLQDVDVLWLRNPLEFLSSSRFKSFDVIFQDDGSRIPRFAPYFANTGFFFVKNNDRTVYLFNHLIRMGDVIKTVQCDQRAMSIVMNEIISWKGLRVKVLARDSEEGLLFPGGFHFHRRFEFMRKFLKDKVEPYVFHSSWATNKVEKRMFLSQLGLWFVHSSCAGEAADDFRLPAAGGVSETCCAAEPIVQCHYSDMPSRGDCRDLDPLVQDRVPFWSPANVASE
jgi:Nucleotide-diphospho-sugar transferase